tara:strand:+ start:262002 stop:262250 length:249 start_codon:yes stop_codon:yes gene_type:complete
VTAADPGGGATSTDSGLGGIAGTYVQQGKCLSFFLIESWHEMASFTTTSMLVFSFYSVVLAHQMLAPAGRAAEEVLARRLPA